VFVREYRFTLTEYDPECPWIVVSTQHRTIELRDGSDFFAWARDRWPRPRWSVQLDPWQLAAKWPGGPDPSKRS
jgi:hypothetical protein